MKKICYSYSLFFCLLDPLILISGQAISLTFSGRSRDQGLLVPHSQGTYLSVPTEYPPLLKSISLYIAFSHLHHHEL